MLVQADVYRHVISGAPINPLPVKMFNLSCIPSGFCVCTYIRLYVNKDKRARLNANYGFKNAYIQSASPIDTIFKTMLLLEKNQEINKITSV